MTGLEPYHRLKVHETFFGPMAFTFRGIAIGLRDLGMYQSPQDAFLTVLGIETLSLRMGAMSRERRAGRDFGSKRTRVSSRSAITVCIVQMVRAGPAASPPQGRRRNLHLRGERAVTMLA